MKHKFLILGGDLRSVHLAQMLEEAGNKVYVYALEKSEKLEENKLIEKCNSLKTGIEKSEIIVAPIPLSKDDKEINTPLSDEKIQIEEFLKNNKSKIFISRQYKKWNKAEIK